MSIYKELSYEQNIDLVTGIQFSVMGAEEIRDRSVAEILSTDTYAGNEPIHGGLFDPRMGVTDHSKICTTCEQKNTFCTGHFGHIELAKPLFYIHYFDTIKKMLKCICFKCSKLLIDKESSELKRILNKKISRQKKFDAIYKICSKNKIKRCGKLKDDAVDNNGCGAKQPSKITKDNIGKIILQWKDTKDDENEEEEIKVYLASDILKILLRITDEDSNILGFPKNINRPENLICQVFPVCPPSVRQSVTNDTGQRCHDDLTHKLCDIVKTNNTLKSKIEKGSSNEQIEYWTILLQYHLSTFFDNKIPGIAQAKQRSGRPLRSLTERLKSKEGRIRGNLMGKRVDFSARSVITPDPCISINELGVPIKIAMNLTYPEKVNSYNKEKLLRLIENGPNKYPGAKYLRKINENMRTIRLKGIDTSKLVIEAGDIVDRHVMNGDFVLFNRQPSLHKMSMMSHKVRVMPYDTFRLNPAVTPSYNADYDGDEMNLHLPQSIQTENELKMLSNVILQIISPRESKPIISVVQDVTLGLYRLTKDETVVNEKQLFNLLMSNTKFIGNIPDAEVHIKGNKKWTGKQVLSEIIPNNINLVNGNNQYDADINKNDKKNLIIIENGNIKQGIFDKKIYQDRTNGLVHIVYNENGEEEARHLFDNTQKLICDWLVYTGFSVGVSDLLVSKKINSDMDNILTDMKKKVYDIIKKNHMNKFENNSFDSNKQNFENEINNLLNNAIGKVGKIALNNITDENRMVNMVKSKSKGNPVNIAQMISSLGQQNVDGKRISDGYNDRTLPHYTKYDDGPECRGFVENSFVNGLTPQEFYFHAMGGREGLIDTAVKTAETGYIQRKLIKSMEDCKISYDLTVRSATGSIIQFLYGEDGMNAIKLESQKLYFIDMTRKELEDNYLFRFDDCVKNLFKKNVFEKLSNNRKWETECYEHYKNILNERSYVISKMFNNLHETSVLYPISFKRIISNARNLFHIKKTQTDLEPIYVLEEINKITTELYLNNNNKGNKLLQILIMCYLSPKQVIIKYRLNKLSFNYIIEQIKVKFLNSIAHPSEMVGVVAAQSIGEPCTQLTLNSVEYNTPILLDINGKFKKVKIGEYIDNRIKNSKKENIENHPNDTTLEYIKDDKVKVLAPTEDGRIIWDNIKAVTKHPVINQDGSSTLLKVTTRSGRTIIATKAKGFMKRVNNKIVGVTGDELKIGDYIPISNVLKINQENIINKWNITQYLPKTDYLYTSEVKTALGLYDYKKSIKEPWWTCNKGHLFELPYSRCDGFIEAYRGSKRTNYKPKRKFEELEGCIYPCRVTKQPSHIPEEFELDELFGFFIGAYMSEGCCTKYHVLISNLDNDFNQKINKFCNKYSINYHIDDNNGKMKNNGHTKTLRLHSLLLAQILLKSIGTGSSNKIFPSIFLQAPDEFLKGLIDGYFSGDGTIGKSEIMATSVSKELLEGIQAILMRFNIQSSVKSQEKTQIYNINKGIKAKLSYNLYINCEGKQIFRDTFNLTIKSKNDKLKSYISKEKYSRLNIIPDVVLSNYTKDIKRCDLQNIKNSLSNEEDIKVIQNIENEDIWYDRIIKIEEFESEHNYVYDFTTDITKNFTDYYGSALRDTFHSAGVSSASQTVRGVPRIKELLSVSKNIKGPSTKVYINKGINQDRNKCKQILNTLETTNIRDIISSSTIYYDPSDSTTTIGDDIEFIKIYKQFEEEDDNCKNDSPWLLRFEFNKNKMFDLGVTMHDIHQTIYEYYENIIKCYYSDDNASKLVFRIRIDESDSKIKSSDMITELKALEQNIIDNIIIKGIKGIKKVILLENKKMEYDETKEAFVNTTEWFMDTNGNNLLDILSQSNVDYTRTISNDVNEVYEIFGIEAARLVLLNELNEMLASEGVNYRHISLLVDTMTNKGSLLSIDRHGINRSDIGPFAKCSFEETSDMLIKAGIFGEYDKINGVSANIMLGQVAPCGTGDTQIMIDEDKLMNINDIDEDEIYDIDDNMCTDEALSFDFDMPMISKSDNDKRQAKDILLKIK
jgi:DNA-directed RNA polymerase II subunit RPB1